MENKSFLDSSDLDEKYIFKTLLIAMAIVFVMTAYAIYVALQPIPFSQVWIDTNTIPKTVTVGQPVQFDFFVKSSEFQKAHYISAVGVGQYVLWENKFDLDVNKSKKFHVAFVMPKVDDKKVKIDLNVTKYIYNDDGSVKDKLTYNLWMWVDVNANTTS